MHTDEQFEELENEEYELTITIILAMFLILADTKSELEKEVRAFYQKYGKDGVVTYKDARKWISERDHQRRLTALQLWVSDRFLAMGVDLEKQFRQIVEGVLKKEMDFFDIDLDLDKLSLEWGIDNLDWLERLSDDITLWKTRINNDLKRSTLTRMNIEEVLALVDKRFESMESVLKSLGVTESSAVGSIGRHEIFKKLGINKYQYFTQVDERRCETCGAMHGLIFPISAYEPGVTASPMHPNCRCWEIPIMED